LIDSSNGTLNLYKGLNIDISTEHAPIITARNIELALKGLFFTNKNGEIEPAMQPPVMPNTDAFHKSEV